ncbi:CHC2 zinc finger domain-containing protein [Streptomyces sp. NPDC037389]|uniref:CHC2 zinc finger domain-containing protein n=1 Tax=Streptomyces sp. NPDC037389 TaxID=3155369 RepID=UPI0033E02B42
MRTPYKPPIVAVLTRYYPHWQPPAQRGGWTKCLCPFHDERTPSASINFEKNRVHCFACDLSLDSIDVIQKEEGVKFIEATRLAESRFGGSSQALSQPVRGEPSRTIHSQPRFGVRGRQVQTRLRFRADHGT